MPDDDHLARWLSDYPHMRDKTKNPAWEGFLRTHPVPAKKDKEDSEWMDLVNRLQE